MVVVDYLGNLGLAFVLACVLAERSCILGLGEVGSAGRVSRRVGRRNVLSEGLVLFLEEHDLRLLALKKRLSFSL